MKMRDTIAAVCATPPVRGLVVWFGRTGWGRRLLTMLAPYRGVYSSLEEAWRAAGKNRHPGHEHPDAVHRHLPLAQSLRPSDYAVLYWLRRLSGNVRLFDYGGNMGNVFYSCIGYLEPLGVTWTVYDLPLVIEIARQMASQRAGPLPHFTTSITDAAGANVLLVSGSFHFWEKSTVEFLDQFPQLPEHVFVNRSPFYERDRQSVVSMQSTYDFAFPIVVRSVSELIGGFTSRGYKLIDRWAAPEYSHVTPFFPEDSVHSYSGFYFRRT